MSVRLNPYLSFKGNAREAMEFYQSVFGGSVSISTFAEMGAAQDPAEGDLVMHATLEADHGITLMASDTPARVQHTPGSTVSLSLSGDDEEALAPVFSRLAEGGTVTMPLEKAVWGDTFGMCTDRFGMAWMVNITG